MIYIGIDPGATGGLAWCNESRQGAIIPWSTAGLVCMAIREELLSQVKWVERAYSIIIEEIHAWPGRGVVSTFKFGVNYGQWCGLLTGLGLQYSTVSPQRWMKHFGVVSKSKDRLSSLRKAVELFPHWDIPERLADAVLICEYARVSNA